MTRYLSPEPITRERAGRLQDTAKIVIGKSLIGIRYRFPVGTPWPSGYARGQFDEVDSAVVLDFTDEITLICSWAMDGFTEGIDLEAGLSDTFVLPADRESEFDVGVSGSWSALRGEVLSGVSVTWQQSSEYAFETVWAMRLIFASGASVEILLGEVRDGEVQYQPDGLVVFFDRQESEAYRREYETKSVGQAHGWQPVAV
jgi:hypothetical protein